MKNKKCIFTSLMIACSIPMIWTVLSLSHLGDHVDEKAYTVDWSFPIMFALLTFPPAIMAFFVGRESV